MKTFKMKKVIAIITAVSLMLLQVVPTGFAAETPAGSIQDTGVTTSATAPTKPADAATSQSAPNTVADKTSINFLASNKTLSTIQKSVDPASHKNIMQKIPRQVQAYIKSLQKQLGSGFKVTCAGVRKTVPPQYKIQIQDSKKYVTAPTGGLKTIAFNIAAKKGSSLKVIPNSLAAVYYGLQGSQDVNGPLLFEGIRQLLIKQSTTSRTDLGRTLSVSARFVTDQEVLVAMARIVVNSTDTNDAIHFTKGGVNYKCYRDANGQVRVEEIVATPPEVQAFLDTLKEQIRNDFSVTATRQDDGTYLVKINRLSACPVGETCVASAGQLWAMSFSLTEAGIVVADSVSADYGINGVINGKFLLEAMGALEESFHAGQRAWMVAPPYYYARLVSYMAVITVTESADNLLRFSYKEKNYKAYRDSDGQVKVEEIVAIPPAVQTYVDQLQADVGDGFEVTVEYNAPTAEYLVKVADIKQYVVESKGTLEYLSCILAPDGTFKSVKQMTYHGISDVDSGLLYEGLGQLVITIPEADRSVAVLTEASKITVTEVDSDGAIHFTSNEKTYKCYRDSNGEVKLEEEVTIPPAVQTVIDQLTKELPDYRIEYKGVVASVGTGPLFLIALQDLRETIAKGHVESMELHVNSAGNVAEVMSAVANGIGNINGELLFEALQTLPCPLSENPDIYALKNMSRLVVTSVDENGAIHFTLGETNYKCYRDSNGQVVLEKETIIIELTRAEFEAAVEAAHVGGTMTDEVYQRIQDALQSLQGTEVFYKTTSPDGSVTYSFQVAGAVSAVVTPAYLEFYLRSLGAMSEENINNILSGIGSAQLIELIVAPEGGVQLSWYISPTTMRVVVINTQGELEQISDNTFAGPTVTDPAGLEFYLASRTDISDADKASILSAIEGLNEVRMTVNSDGEIMLEWVHAQELEGETVLGIRQLQWTQSGLKYSVQIPEDNIFDADLVRSYVMNRTDISETDKANILYAIQGLQQIEMTVSGDEVTFSWSTDANTTYFISIKENEVIYSLWIKEENATYQGITGDWYRISSHLAPDFKETAETEYGLQLINYILILPSEIYEAAQANLSSEELTQLNQAIRDIGLDTTYTYQESADGSKAWSWVSADGQTTYVLSNRIIEIQEPATLLTEGNYSVQNVWNFEARTLITINNVAAQGEALSAEVRQQLIDALNEALAEGKVITKAVSGDETAYSWEGVYEDHSATFMIVVDPSGELSYSVQWQISDLEFVQQLLASGLVQITDEERTALEATLADPEVTIEHIVTAAAEQYVITTPMQYDVRHFLTYDRSQPGIMQWVYSKQVMVGPVQKFLDSLKGALGDEYGYDTWTDPDNKNATVIYAVLKELPKTKRLVDLRIVVDANGAVMGVSSSGIIEWSGSNYQTVRVDAQLLFEGLKQLPCPLSVDPDIYALKNMSKLTVTSVDSDNVIRFTLGETNYQCYWDADGNARLEEIISFSEIPQLYAPSEAMVFPATLQHYDANRVLIRKIKMNAEEQIESVAVYGNTPNAQIPAKVEVYPQGSDRLHAVLEYNAEGQLISSTIYDAGGTSYAPASAAPVARERTPESGAEAAKQWLAAELKIDPAQIVLAEYKNLEEPVTVAGELIAATAGPSRYQFHFNVIGQEGKEYMIVGAWDLSVPPAEQKWIKIGQTVTAVQQAPIFASGTLGVSSAQN